jgi:hypothetical protein
LQEAIMRNIEACKKLSDITRTSLGPNGMNKLVRAAHTSGLCVLLTRMAFLAGYRHGE